MNFFERDILKIATFNLIGHPEKYICLPRSYPEISVWVGRYFFVFFFLEI